MKKIYSLLLILSILILGGCKYPFQSDKYPAWTTKGLLESYTLTDGRVVDGWMGAKVGSQIDAKWYSFTILKTEELKEYMGYKAKDGYKLIHASIKITNTSDKKVYLFDGDFALVWNLDKSQRSYAYSKDPFTESMLSNEMSLDINETKTIDTLYEINKNVKKPMAIYYYEQYTDGQKGNKYYVYI